MPKSKIGPDYSAYNGRIDMLETEVLKLNNQVSTLKKQKAAVSKEWCRNQNQIERKKAKKKGDIYKHYYLTWCNDLCYTYRVVGVSKSNVMYTIHEARQHRKNLLTPKKQPDCAAFKQELAALVKKYS